MTIELYHNDMSTCAQKVRLTLAEKTYNGKVTIWTYEKEILEHLNTRN